MMRCVPEKKNNHKLIKTDVEKRELCLLKQTDSSSFGRLLFVVVLPVSTSNTTTNNKKYSE